VEGCFCYRINERWKLVLDSHKCSWLMSGDLRLLCACRNLKKIESREIPSWCRNFFNRRCPASIAICLPRKCMIGDTKTSISEWRTAQQCHLSRKEVPGVRIERDQIGCVLRRNIFLSLFRECDGSFCHALLEDDLPVSIMSRWWQCHRRLWRHYRRRAHGIRNIHCSIVVSDGVLQAWCANHRSTSWDE
jgi:hypothetical protein